MTANESEFNEFNASNSLKENGWYPAILRIREMKFHLSNILYCFCCKQIATTVFNVPFGRLRAIVYNIADSGYLFERRKCIYYNKTSSRSFQTPENNVTPNQQETMYPCLVGRNLY